MAEEETGGAENCVGISGLVVRARGPEDDGSIFLADFPAGDGCGRTRGAVTVTSSGGGA